MKLDSVIFYTNNLGKAVSFYCDKVGLEVDYIQEDRFASFKFKNGKLGIKKAKEEREMPGYQTVFIEVENIEEVYNQFKAKGINFRKELIKEDWGTNFSFLDPDGNKPQFISKQ